MAKFEAATTPVFGRYTINNVDYKKNTLLSEEEGINIVNTLGLPHLASIVKEEALVNNPAEGHALGVIS
ncbi:MAG: hypothetical protein K6E29_04145 [Cyanobacteria bacterium RUI128]|nr:hypothetical protein [Cyanobacteria bacterium RUI128]